MRTRLLTNEMQTGRSLPENGIPIREPCAQVENSSGLEILSSVGARACVQT
jgi:hypothetical protein